MYAAANSLLPGLSGLKTYAAWPVWSNSFREEVIFTRLPKKKAIKLYHRARAWNRTRQAGRYGGGIGSAALRVLESLIFDFLNFATGRLDPSYTALEGRARSGTWPQVIMIAAFLDANVLYPATLRSVMLELARNKAFRVLWSEQVH